MTDCLVTGMPNVGKTSFVINFAEYLGVKELKFYIRQVAGYTSVQSYTPLEARNELISVEKNFTRQVQSIKIEIPAGKVLKELRIIDSCGLAEGIHPDAQIRTAMAQTLRLIRESNLILHIIDLGNLREGKEILPSIDQMIMDYASLDKNYALLANKIDLEYVQDNLNRLISTFNSITIIPISALYQQGFKEVKKLVLRYV